MQTKCIISFCFLIIGFSIFGQQNSMLKKIDSLNNLPYDQRIETSNTNLKRYLTNLEDSKKINYKLGLADSYANLFLIYFYKGNYDLSSDYFFKAIELYKSLNELGKTANLYSLFGYRIRHQDIKKSQEYMQIGIKLAQKVGDDFNLMGMYDNYGVVKEVMKDYDSAFYFYNKSLRMKQKAKDEVGIPYSLNKIAALNATLGNFSTAKKDFDLAYKLRLKLKDEIGIAENLHFYGVYYDLQNITDSATNYFKKALKISKKAGYDWLTYQIFNDLSSSSIKKNDYKNAFLYLKQHLTYKDSIYNQEATNYRNDLEVQFETREKETKILEQRAVLAEQKLKIEQKNKFLYGLGALVLLLGVSAFLIFRIQKLKNQQLINENLLKDSLNRIETQNKIQEERLRISRDLHDNIGSQMTFVISSLDNLKFQIGNQNPEASQRIETINQFTRATINELRDTIWAMNKENISVADLILRVTNFIENAKSAAPNIHFNLVIDDQLNEDHIFSSFEGINLYRVIQEAVNNAIKYAKASKIEVEFSQKNQKFIIQINDNGIGIDELKRNSGNGLNNMVKRMNDIGSEFDLQSQEGKGTKVQISI